MRAASKPWPIAPIYLVFAAAVALSSALRVQGHDNTLTVDPARATGIWKAVVPLRPMRGEFDNFDPLGVAAGARIKADCSLNWVDPDDGKLYCFSSGTSLEYFLDQPHANVLRARQGWQKLTAAKP